MSLTLSPEDVRRRKRFLQITRRDERRIRNAGRLIRASSLEIIDRFYRFLQAQPHTAAILRKPGVLGKVKAHQRAYFERLTRGVYDRDYFEDRLRTGYAHDRIGLTPEWYLGAYNVYLSLVCEVLGRKLKGRNYGETVASLTKVVFLDMGLAMDAYIHAGMDRLRERTRSLEEMDAKKRLLADTIVHDLRNPVAGIQGFLTILKESGALPEPMRKASEEAERALAILNGLVDNVLDISRIEEGTLPLSVEELDLRKLVDETARVLEPFARTRKKALRTEHSSRVLRGRSDETLVRRMLFNLVINSIRHAAGATHVTIRTRRFKGGSQIEVIDDGPGIPERYHASVFDKFGATAMRKAGLKMDTGLGLVFCGLAAQYLGAKLELQSAPGKGTRIRITLDGAKE